MTVITPKFITVRSTGPREAELAIGVADNKIAVIGPLTRPMLERLAAEAANAVWNWNAWGKQ